MDYRRVSTTCPPGDTTPCLSIFFISYAVFEPQTNVLLKRMKPSDYPLYCRNAHLTSFPPPHILVDSVEGAPDWTEELYLYELPSTRCTHISHPKKASILHTTQRTLPISESTQAITIWPMEFPQRLPWTRQFSSTLPHFKEKAARVKS